jgi:hypothetical protein
VAHHPAAYLYGSECARWLPKLQSLASQMRMASGVMLGEWLPKWQWTLPSMKKV